MNSHLEGLKAWFEERPKWLQDAARRIVDAGSLTQDDLDELVLICGNEAGVDFGAVIVPAWAPLTGSLLLGDGKAKTVELKAVSNLSGINALNPKKPLSFSSGLNIVYGQNGAGKSGYTRLLKQVCGAKNTTQILQNVFARSAGSQSCEIDYVLDGNTKKCSWVSGAEVEAYLSTVEIYDRDCGAVYVDDENELAYEPALLRMFSLLILVCGQLSNEFDSLASKLVSAKPNLPQDHYGTNFGGWYSQLKSYVSKDKVEEMCRWLDSDQKEMDNLVVRLNTLDAKDEAIKLRKSRSEIDKLVKGFKNWQGKLSVKNCQSYLDKKKEVAVKGKAAADYAKSIFSDVPLSGVGEESWKLMWEQARNYSSKSAYPGVGFPHVDEGSVCLMCQQPLDDNAKKRLEDFEGFVKGELDKAAKLSSSEFEFMDVDIVKYPNEELISTMAAAANVDDELQSRILALRNSIEQTVSKLRRVDFNVVFASTLGFSLVSDLEVMSETIENKALQFDVDAGKSNRNELVARQKELGAKKWVSGQKESIFEELNRLKKKKNLDSAKSLVNTTMLSKKKSSLAKELVTEEYIARFEKEIAHLGADRLRIKLEKTRAPKGKVFFRLKLDRSLVDFPVGKVLSEGEFRIVSLAAFLADVEGRADNSTFIFDDPISSLDQEYEELVASRLVTLSKSRQVIVFTHRLSLLADLDQETDSQGLSRNLVGLYKEPWGDGEPGLPPMHTQKTKAAINTLIAKVPEGRDIHQEHGSEQYSWWAKSICSEARITLERVIEFDLLADVVQRFRRPINTKGKLANVAKVTSRDCEYIDDLMTKLSKFEHAQPSEAPVMLPNPDELGLLLTGLKSWRDSFVTRQV